MFEQEAKEYAERTKTEKEFEVLDTVHYWGQESLSTDERRLFKGIQDRKIAREQGFKEGAEFGYNRGYHDAEEHYMNVIDSQHKLVDESKKEEFKKCMKCTDSTYQYELKDGYNHVNKWCYPSKNERPKEEFFDEYTKHRLPSAYKRLYCLYIGDNCCIVGKYIRGKFLTVEGQYSLSDIIAWKEIILPDEDSL